MCIYLYNLPPINGIIKKKQPDETTISQGRELYANLEAVLGMSPQISNRGRESPYDVRTAYCS